MSNRGRTNVRALLRPCLRLSLLVSILLFFATHWIAAVFFQSFFLHRYCAHRMFQLSPGWERTFHLLTYLAQGSSYLTPRAYAALHREHHAYSDTERDPHSPHVSGGLMRMMLQTLRRYRQLREVEAGGPVWPLVDRFADSWVSPILFGAFYTSFYLWQAPPAWAYLLLPIHFLMGPVHGAIVNWCGHKYGYRNFSTAGADRSRNSLPLEFLTMGELLQNNHHRFPMSANFAARRFELDPSYVAIWLLSRAGVLQLKTAHGGS